MPLHPDTIALVQGAASGGNAQKIGKGALMQHGNRVSDVFAPDNETSAHARSVGEKRPAPQTTMVVHFTARSGSTWLSDVLSRAGLGMGPELFNPNFMPNMANRFGARTLGEYVRLGPRYIQRNGVCSFEITGHQLKVVFASAADFHAAFPDALSYWLIREDIVAQAISLQKMVEAGVGHSIKIDSEGRKQADARFEYDAEGIRKWVLHSLNAERYSEQFFADFGITPFRMSYERNIALGEEGLLSLFQRHTGLSDLPPPPRAPEANRHEKLATDKNRDFAERFRAGNADFLAEVAEARAETLARLSGPETAEEGAGRRAAAVTQTQMESPAIATQPARRQTDLPLILHIGAHKTGTTLVQKTFHQHRAKLARHDVIYPDTNRFHFAQHRLAFALKGKRDPSKRDLPRLEAEAAELAGAMVGVRAGARSPDTRFFLSSEAFFELGRDRIEALHRALPTRNVSILAVLRRPDTLLLSIYNQKMKGPRNRFSSPIDEFWDHPERLSGDLDMARCVETWASVFGRDRILLRCYEDAGPLEIALGAVGLPADLVTEPKRLNRSTPAAVAEIIRLAKVRGMDPEEREGLLRRAMRHHKGGAPFEPGTERRRSVLAAMQPDLDRLFAQFGMENPYRPETVPDGLVPTPDLGAERLLNELLR